MKKFKKLEVSLGLMTSLLASTLSMAFIPDTGAIRGNIQGKDGTVIKLLYRYNGVDHVDSTILKANQFALKTAFPETVQCTLSNSDNQQIKIFLAEQKTIALSGEVAKFYALKITGAAQNELYESFKAKTLNLSGEYRKALQANGGDRKDKQNPDYLAFQKRVDSVTLDFVKQNHNSAVAALSIIDSYLNNGDRKKAAVAYALLSPQAKKGFYAKRIKQFIDTENTIKKGNLAPTFALNDLQGKNIQLTAYRGRFVFLDFWASWCPPCRAEHPLLRKLQAKYANEIDFISVSMDASVTAWKQAVQVDQLTWTQLNDQRSTNGEVADSYGIKSLPFNCIIDPEGKIIATKLRGEDLERFLFSLFGEPKGK